MDKFVKLGQDMVLLWSKYKVMYWEIGRAHV